MKSPTALQLALAADVARRFAESRELSAEDETHVLNASNLMGLAALNMPRPESEPIPADYWETAE